MGLTIENVTNLARAGRVQAWFSYNHAWTFTCCTTVSTGDHRTFGNLRIDPSNRYIRKSSNEILTVQDRFPNWFNRGVRCPDQCHTSACQQSDWYESINRPTITTPPSSPRRGEWTFSTYASWSVRRERRRLIATKKKKKKRRRERTLLNFFNYRIKATSILLLEIQVLSVSFLRFHFF